MSRAVYGDAVSESRWEEALSRVDLGFEDTSRPVLKMGSDVTTRGLKCIFERMGASIRKIKLSLVQEMPT